MAASPKQAFAAILWELAELEASATSRRSFRAKAYANAVWSLDAAFPDLSDPPEALLANPGIGTGVLGLVEEFRETGTIRRLEALRSSLPGEARELSRLPRMNPTRLRWLKAEHGIETPADLLEAIRAGNLAELSGVGPATEAVWEERLLTMIAGDGLPIYRAAVYAGRWASHIATHAPDSMALVTGAIRRLDEHVKVCELVAVAGPGLSDFLRNSALVLGARGDGSSHDLDTLGGRLVVHESSPSSLGTVLVATTGPEDHVRALRRFDDPLPERATEEEVYAALSVDFVPPPARLLEIAEGAEVVTTTDLRGDMHIHTTRSPDGRQTLEAVADGAEAAGFEYIAVTDHGWGLRFGGLDVDDLARQREEIAMVQESHPDLRILHGAELNIGRRGEVDYDDDVLAWLDFRLAAVHSFFDLDRVAQTERLLATISHPLIHAIGHLTGRRIGIRPSIRLDVPAVLEAAAATSTALEVNGHLDRLELSAEHCRLANSLGVVFVANSDSHRAPETANLANAVGVLQRAGVRPEQVVNTWPLARLESWLAGG